jgi:hypothetical protein
MMNWILLAMAAVAGVVLAIAMGGLLAPRVRVTTRMLTCDRSPEEVFRRVREADGPPRWHPSLPTMQVEEDAPPQRLRFVLLSDDGAPFGIWQVTVAAHDGQTITRLTETVNMANPIVRFLASVGGAEDRPRAFLESLARELGVSPSAVVVQLPTRPDDT